MYAFFCSRLIAQYIAEYATAYPAGSIIPSPSQNNASVSAACIKPGMINVGEFLVISIAVMLAIFPTIVTLLLV